jgi:hypothetical protein
LTRTVAFNAAFGTRNSTAAGEETMSIPAVLAPVFVLVALTFALAIWMGVVRNRAIYAGQLKIRDIALTKDAWPDRAKQIGNSYHNQYELPVLFYVLVALALITRKADLIFVVMSWVFVLSRLLHAFIHTTTNRVPRRFFAYLVGLAILILMWAIFAVRILLAT